MSETLLTVLQLNCQGSYDVMCDFGECLRSMNVGVALVQEPYVSDGCIRGLPASMRAFVNASGGSAVIVDNVNMDVMLVGEYTNEWGVCVSIKGVFGTMYVVSVYCKFCEEIGPYIAYMESLVRGLRNECVLIGLDANASSPLWFSKGAGRGGSNILRGRELEEWIVGSRMNVLNEASEWYTFSGARGQSDIDVTIVNGMCDRFEFEWKILPECGLSDHNVIQVVCKSVMLDRASERTGERWSTKGVDWGAYVDYLGSLECMKSDDEFRSMTLDEKVRFVYECVHEANEFKLQRLVRKRPTRVKWFTDELRSKKRTVNRLRQTFQNDRRLGVDSVESFRAYRRERSVYQSMMRSTKESDWRQFVTDHGNTNPWGDVYKLCSKRKKVNDICSMKVGNVWTKSWNESVEVLMGEFFPGDRGSHSTLPRPPPPPPPPLQWDEVNDAVYECGLRKAPGLDGINGEIMRAVWKGMNGKLFMMYEQCMNEGRFPKEWKVGDVVVLLKSPDKVKHDPHSYRPICLLSVMGKVLERVMVKRMNAKRVNVNAAQYGFTKGKSTEDALLRMHEIVGMSDKKYVLGLFVDFKGAFDNVVWSRVIEKLDAIGCEELSIWESYFSERSACVNGNSGCVWKSVQRGTPQGSICGPSVWNLMMDDLLHTLERCGCKVIAYADDLLLLVEGMSRSEVERMGTRFMAEVVDWGMRVGVNVSKEKTVCMLLKGRLSASRPPIVRVNGVGMKYVVVVRYLGLNIGERMSYKPHLAVLHKKTAGVVGCLRRVLRKDWGLNDRTVRMIFRGLIVPCITYGAIVWYGMAQLGYARDALNRCQRIVMYACLRVCRTVSTDALQVLMGELPWDLQVIRRGLHRKAMRGIQLTSGDLVTESECVGLSIKDRKALVDNRMCDIWQRRWDESIKGRCTYAFVKDVKFNADGMFGFGLHLGYLITGHGSMNEYLNKRGLANTTECLCGYAVEDWKHILAECEMYADERRLSDWGIRYERGVLNVDRVLQNVSVVRELNDFARLVFARRASMM